MPERLPRHGGRRPSAGDGGPSPSRAVPIEEIGNGDGPETRMFARKFFNKSFDGTRILVVGDVMLDRFVYGKVSRISPEAPVPVLHVDRASTMLGGAANVMANAVSIGAEAVLIGLVGADPAGAHCAELVAAHPRARNGLITRPDICTTVKTRYVSNGQQIMRCDEEVVRHAPAEVEDRVIAAASAAMADCDVLAISDYAKGLLTDRVLAEVIAAARARGIPVIVDPKRRDFSAYRGATLIKPNRAELRDATGHACADLEGCAEAAARVIEQTGADLLVTLSDEGMALFRAGREPLHSPASAREIFDVSGAGDTALAVFCAALGASHSMEQATFLANAGAGAVVRRAGTAALTPSELSRELNRINRPLAHAVASLEDAAEIVEGWKREGLSVGFTNGCFDIVHAGHVAMLAKSAEQCDRLVVGLNSDASVSRLKGSGRPVQPLVSRAEVLAAMQSVDLVVPFEEDTPLELISALLPDVLVKGADYREEDVVGGDVVKAAGGRVALIELVPGLSTTRAVERIRSAQGSADVVASLAPPVLSVAGAATAEPASSAE